MGREVQITPQSVAEAAARAVDVTGLATRPTEAGVQVEENFDIHPTHIPGFHILTDHGATIDHLTIGQIERLHELGGPYTTRSAVIKSLEGLQEKPRDGEELSPHDEIEAFAPVLGIRGGRDERSGWEIQLNPHPSHQFDAALVESSGKKAAGYVSRRVVVSITLDPNEDVAGFVSSVRGRMRRQGIDKTALTRDEVVTIDESGLRRAEEKGEVTLHVGAHTVTIERHNVVPRIIPTLEDKEVIERAVFEPGPDEGITQIS